MLYLKMHQMISFLLNQHPSEMSLPHERLIMQSAIRQKETIIQSTKIYPGYGNVCVRRGGYPTVCNIQALGYFYGEQLWAFKF